MANVRDLNRKILSLQNMQKVMRAMNMIASTKFKKMSRIQDSLAQFKLQVDAIRSAMYRSFRGQGYPLIDGYDEVNRCHIFMFTSDRGLCGSHNNSVNRRVMVLAEKKKKENISVDVSCVGTKGASFCRKKGLEIFQHSEINDKTFKESSLGSMGGAILDEFLKDSLQEIYLIYNEFESTLVQNTRVIKVFPMKAEDESGPSTGSGMLCEPEPAEFVRQGAQALLNYRLKTALLNSYLSEHAARMTAMENATNNSEDLIFRYGKIRNRARQATITNELIEIVAGKEALKE